MSEDSEDTVAIQTSDVVEVGKSANDRRKSSYKDRRHHMPSPSSRKVRSAEWDKTAGLRANNPGFWEIEARTGRRKPNSERRVGKVEQRRGERRSGERRNAPDRRGTGKISPVRRSVRLPNVAAARQDIPVAPRISRPESAYDPKNEPRRTYVPELPKDKKILELPTQWDNVRGAARRFWEGLGPKSKEDESKE
jgi:hypothetical protein